MSAANAARARSKTNKAKVGSMKSGSTPRPTRSTGKRVAPSHAEVHSFETPQGLRVEVTPQPHLNTAAAVLLLRVGSRFETAELRGISHFLEHMTFRGTARLRSPGAQAAAFEDLGGSLDAATGVDHGTLAATTLPEHLEEAIALLGEVAIGPSLRGIEIERGTVREELLEDYDEDGVMIDPDGVARGLLYGDHPLGFPIAGDLKSIERFDRASLGRHHRRHYTAKNAVLAIAGNVPSLAKIARAASSAFAEMKTGERLAAPPPPAQRAMAIRTVRTASSQTSVRFAFRASGRGQPLEPATEILLSVLDGGLSSRLYSEICLARGLVYEISASYEAFEEDGIFDVAAETEHARVPEVVEAIATSLARLRDRGPTDVELERARRRHTFSRRASWDSPVSSAERAGAARLLGGLSYAPELRLRELGAVDRGMVRRAAELVLANDNLALVTVGRAGPSLERTLRKSLVRL